MSIEAISAQAASELPEGLYIPPDALEIIVDRFSGPLDLLLWLIRRNRMDIRDIPVAEVTRQYLHYLEEARRRHLEIAADYLLMAAWLAEIKARMLLPVPLLADEESLDPREELARRLHLLAKVQARADALAQLPRLGADFLLPTPIAHDPLPVKPPFLAVERLQELYVALQQRRRAQAQARPRLVNPWNLRERLLQVLACCQNAARPLSFRETLRSRDPQEIGLTLLAILELLRQRALRLLRLEEDWQIVAPADD